MIKLSGGIGLCCIFDRGDWSLTSDRNVSVQKYGDYFLYTGTFASEKLCFIFSLCLTEGKMNIHIEDMNNKRKENAVIEIEELPLNERMVRVISRGITKVHSYK